VRAAAKVRHAGVDRDNGRSNYNLFYFLFYNTDSSISQLGWSPMIFRRYHAAIMVVVIIIRDALADEHCGSRFLVLVGEAGQ